MFTLTSSQKSYSVDFPTDIREITADYFNAILSDVKVQQHYCIVAMCFKDKVFNVASALKNKTNPTSNVTSIIAKIDKDNECGFEQMERAVIDRTSLERGIHLRIAANAISVSGFEDYVSKDAQLIDSLVKGTYYRSGASNLVLKSGNGRIDSPSIYLVEFKIIPIRDIVATRPVIGTNNCIFINRNKNSIAN